jgi:hypothetical protein
LPRCGLACACRRRPTWRDYYLPLVYAIAPPRGALEELAHGESLNIAIDRTLHWSSEMEAMVSRIITADQLLSSEPWSLFIVPGKPRPALFLGARLKAAEVRVNREAEDVVRLADGNIESAWGPGVPQDGTEEVLIDLGTPQEVRTVLLAMGAFSFGFPRELAVETSADERQWRTVRHGETDVLTIRAVLLAPEVVPLAVDLDDVTARYVRLRQTGRDATCRGGSQSSKSTESETNGAR